jgi:hypothetical protein
MGKVKARELENVHVDFVSIVTEGANGETFKIFRRARNEAEAKEKNATPQGGAKEEGEDTMLPEEKAALEKAAQEIAELTKKNAELTEKLAKTEEVIVAAQKTASDAVARIEAIEKSLASEGEETEPVAEPVAEEPTGDVVELTKSIAALQAQVEKLSGQKREPAGKGTTEGTTDAKTSLFGGVFFGR